MLLFGLEVLAGTYIVTKIAQKKQKKSIGKKLTALEKTKKIEKKTDEYNKNIALSGVSLVGSIILPATSFLQLFNLSILSYSIYPILKETEKSLKEKKIKNDFLNSSIIVICMAQGYYFTSALVSFFYHIGSKMIAKTQAESKDRLTDFLVLKSNTVWLVKENDIEIEMDLKKLKEGDVIVLKSGETIPVDGTVVNGASMVDEQALTGEYQPSEKEKGSKVSATTIVVSGKIYVSVQKSGDETTASKIREILKHTTDHKTQLQLKGQKIADNIALPILGATTVLLPFVGFSSSAALLNSSPGNSLRTWSSLQVLNHITLASEKGILVKDGRVLEELSQIDTVLFDKTGTLTKEELGIGNITLSDNISKEELIKYAASSEQKLEHPIAKALVNKAKKLGIVLYTIDDSHYEIGYGITVEMENNIIQVGSIRFMESQKITIPKNIEDAISMSQSAGNSIILVSVNQRIQGSIEICPQLREEAKEIIQSLRDFGVKQICIVSGDHKYATQKIAQELQLDEFFYNIPPQDKSKVVKQFQKDGKKVCFVGDGINDVIAMKQANVSISLSGASLIATDMADIILMNKGLSHLPNLFEISKSLRKNTNMSFLIPIVGAKINLIGILFFHMGVLPSVILLNGGTTLIGLIHSKMPLMKYKKLLKQKRDKTLPIIHHSG